MEIDEFLDAELGLGPETLKAPSGAAGEPRISGAKAALMGEIDDLISQANDFISKGDFESARQVYLRIKELRAGLPTEFMNSEEKLSIALVDLNRKIISEVDKNISSEFSRKSSEMNQLFDKCYVYIKDGKIASKENLDTVEEAYKQIKERYFGLPEGYAEKKVLVQDQLLKLYKIIITNKNTILSQEFGRKADDLLRLMGLAADEINRKNIDSAIKLFQKISEQYKQLPSGFLKEKTDLQNQMLGIYQKLILSKQSTFSEDFDRSRREIEDMLVQAYDLAKDGKMKDAEQIYNRLTEAYSKLPQGFYGPKAELELKMMELHHLLTLRQNKESLDEAKAKSNEMDLLVQSANNYMLNKEYDLAKEVYDEIIGIYGSFPEGFHEESMRLQGKITDIYRELVRHLHEPIIADTTKDEGKRYDELLKVIVEIHQSIKKKDFTIIKEKYLRAYKLYHGLPLALVEEKTNLYREIYKAYEELRLYNEVDRLQSYAEKEDFEKLKAALSEIADIYNTLSKKYPEDMELFNYIQGKSLIYLSMLKKKAAQAGMQTAPKQEKGADVRKRLAEIAEMKKAKELPVEKPQSASDAGRQAEAQAKAYLGSKVMK